MSEEAEKPTGPKLAAPIDWWRQAGETHIKPEPIEAYSARQNTLVALEAWVRELTARYRLPVQVIPPCWFRHEALIQELLALFQLHRQYSFLGSMPPNFPLDFHHHFHMARSRLREWVADAGCTEARHNEPPISPFLVPESPAAVRYENDLEDFIGAVIHRPFGLGPTEAEGAAL